MKVKRIENNLSARILPQTKHSTFLFSACFIFTNNSREEKRFLLLSLALRIQCYE